MRCFCRKANENHLWMVTYPGISISAEEQITRQTRKKQWSSPDHRVSKGAVGLDSPELQTTEILCKDIKEEILKHEKGIVCYQKKKIKIKRQSMFEKLPNRTGDENLPEEVEAPLPTHHFCLCSFSFLAFSLSSSVQCVQVCTYPISYYMISFYIL